MSGITGIAVCGYKSLCETNSIEIRPLTILAGANGSGKSSVMQPLLLLKQTLEAVYDPGPLVLDGPNVSFTSADQFLARLPNAPCTGSLSIGLEVGGNQFIVNHFKRTSDRNLELVKIEYKSGREHIVLRAEMSREEIKQLVSSTLSEEVMKLADIYAKAVQSREKKAKLEWVVLRSRCFLSLVLRAANVTNTPPFPAITPGETFERHVRRVIHVPALRGNPARTYKATAIGPEFPGTFENYTASVISHWQATDTTRLKKLKKVLAELGLTGTVEAEQIDDVQLELRVGRLAHRIKSGELDVVSIADVGFGVSQVLPVLVALLVAERDQLVYLEQPEIHLHPRAQAALAGVLAEAAKRGVRVVAETHSALLIRAVQSLVAEGTLPADDVKLHWFTRRKDGTTEISSADLDETGAFGDWPEDFATTELDVESRYLDAAMSGR